MRRIIRQGASRPIGVLAIATTATLLALLAFEGVVRLLLPVPRYHREPVEFDPLLGFRGIPGHRQRGSDELGSFWFELNAQGLRGGSLSAAPPQAGVSRLLFVGDSFLVGQMLREDELVTSRVGSALRARGRDVEVLNLSAIDWGTGQEILALRQLAPTYGPDAVVLFLYPANDVINNSLLLAEQTTVSAGDPIRPYVEPSNGELRIHHLHPLRARVRRHSRLFATLESRALALAASRGWSWLDPRPAAESFVERLGQGRAPREDLEIFRARQDPGDRWERAWGTTLDLLRAFRRECDAIGARLLVVVVPSVHQVVRNAKGIRLEIVTRVVTGVALDRILDWNLPERRLAKFFGAEGIEARLLLGPLRDAARSQTRVYLRDEHLSREGHGVAALQVAAWLLGDAESAAPAIRGEPVRALPDAAVAPAWLSFGAEPHADQLGDGWIAWSASGPDELGGWLTGPNALAVLPARQGELVVRGWAPAEASFPIEGQIQVVGVTEQRFRIDGPGSFALRYRVSEGGAPGLATADGYLAVVVAPGETHRVAGLPAGVYVQEIGFETRRDPAGEPDGTRPGGA